MFKNGRPSVTDERSGRPSTSTTEENIERVHAMILDIRWVTIDVVVHHLRISHGSAHGIIQDRLRPIYQGLLKSYCNDCGAFWDELSPGTRSGSTIKIKFKTQPSAGKMILTLFWYA
jgi:hypothetical protein